jgi:hypothetical protein
MLEEMTGFNGDTVHKILVDDLKKKKVCARFVLHLLTPDRKRQRTESSVLFVEMTAGNRNVLKRNVSGDENYCFMYSPETKR